MSSPFFWVRGWAYLDAPGADEAILVACENEFAVEAVGADVLGNLACFFGVEVLGPLEVVLHEELVAGPHDRDLGGDALLHQVPD